MAKKEEFSYDAAIKELNTILLELENNTDINMDDISEKVKRAGELIVFCKKKLHEIDKNLEKTLEKLTED